MLKKIISLTAVLIFSALMFSSCVLPSVTDKSGNREKNPDSEIKDGDIDPGGNPVGDAEEYVDENLKFSLIKSDAEYELSDGKAAIGDVKIPAFYKGKPVTAIGKEAFATSYETWDMTEFFENTGLLSITIPAGVRNINRDAFNGCTSLVSVSFLDGSRLEFIDDRVFADCRSLSDISIPAGIAGIGWRAFAGCIRLEEIIIPISTIAIGDEAFNSCTSLRNIKIPSGMIEIGSYAFNGCEKLAAIEIPESVTYIGEEAFHETAWYNNQADGLVYAGKMLYAYKGEMPPETTIDNIRSDTFAIGRSVFSMWRFDYCENLVGVSIPASVKCIARQAFAGCTNLTTLIFLEGSKLESIEHGAFFGCAGLADILLPESVRDIGSWAFSGTAWLNSQPDGFVYLGKALYSHKGTLPADIDNIRADTTMISTSIKDQGSYTLRSIIIPASVENIGGGLFWSCPNLVSVTFEKGSRLKSIPFQAFSKSEKLTAVNIPDGVTNIEYYAFSGCISLADVIIPAGVINIGYMAFASCPRITSLMIPTGVASVGSSAFSNYAGTLIIEGFSNQLEADMAWGANWRNGISDNAVVIYAKKSFYR
ncbi:MAG: leucine-rich repeat domain-containing protein [Firmicutes bacterium]|nr:leucine-rich repeat domain-containing protein [Bacillota bacterium]